MKTVLVAAGIVIKEKRVLLTQRKSGSHLEGMWEFPGGKVEPGEDPKDALVRELREELGIETVVDDILDVTFHRYDEAEKSVLLLFYETRIAPNSPPPRALDVAAFKWAETSDLIDAQFPPADLGILRKVRARLG